MNQQKAEILDRFASDKVLYGPSRTPESKRAIAAVKADPRMRELRARLREAGFFEPVRWHFAWRLGYILAVILGGWTVMAFSHGLAWRLGAAVAVGFMVVQSSFFAHEAAHGAIGLRAWKVEALGQLTDTFLVGYDFAYFRRSHDLHHFHTNEVDKDPDGLSDLFSVHDWSASRKTGLGRFMTRHQGALLPVLYLLWAFAMKWDGLTYVWRNRARVKLDAAVLVAHVVFWLVVPAILAGPGAALLGYAVWNVVAGLYLALIIPVNHVGLQPIPPGEHVDFVTQQIRGSRNLVGPSWFYDFFFIGLNRQIEHHLFPFVATPRLARGAAVVKAFCAEHGLPYGEERYLAAMAGVHAHLWRVGKRLGEPDAEPAEAPAAAIDG